MVRRYADRILDLDEQYAPFRIVSLESRAYGMKMPVRIGEENRMVRIGGMIDRVDEKDGIIRIIDYKTGLDEKRFKGVGELFDPEEKRNKAVFQTLSYALMVKEKFQLNAQPSDPGLNAGLYLVREMFDPNFSWQFEISDPA